MLDFSRFTDAAESFLSSGDGAQNGLMQRLGDIGFDVGGLEGMAPTDITSALSDAGIDLSSSTPRNCRTRSIKFPAVCR